MTSKFKEIPGFGGAYSITQSGQVRSNPRKDSLGRNWKGQALTPWPNRDGHIQVDLRLLGTTVKGYVHRLVLETFVGPCPKGLMGCHNDGVPANNKLGNLRWDTHKSNCQDAVKHGAYLRGEANGSAKLTELDVRWIRYLSAAGVAMKMLAEAYIVSSSCIEDVIHRRSWAWL